MLSRTLALVQLSTSQHKITRHFYFLVFYPLHRIVEGRSELEKLPTQGPQEKRGRDSKGGRPRRAQEGGRCMGDLGEKRPLEGSADVGALDAEDASGASDGATVAYSKRVRRAPQQWVEQEDEQAGVTASRKRKLEPQPEAGSFLS